MHTNKKTADIIHKAIDVWEEEKTIAPAEADNLRKSVQVIPVNWKKIANYALYISIACILFSIGAVIADEWLIQLIIRFFSSSDIGLCFIFSVSSVVMYLWGLKRKAAKPSLTITNEFIILTGAVFTGVAVIYFGKIIDTGSGHFSLLLLLTTIIYGWLGFSFPSKPLWILALVTLGIWFGTETGYQSGWAFSFWGMNYPVRFVFLGAAVIASSLIWCKIVLFHHLFNITYAAGLTYFFTALWLVSIYGNYDDMQLWMTVRQFEMIYWAILSAVSSVVALYFGFVKNDYLLQRFGIVFLFLNLFTRYSEYFWNSIHKSLFFIILAIAFWVIGYHAEKIWNLTFLKKDKD